MTEIELRAALAAIGLKRPAYWNPAYLKDIDKLSSPQYGMIEEKDVLVPMRDGIKLCVDIFRPDTNEKFPALLAMAAYGKACESIKIPDQPLKDSWVFDHNAEVGDIEFYVARGYAFIIPDERGIGQSEGKWHGFFSTQEQEDAYDLIEWIAEQPWCSGNVGMTGISWFGMIQRLVAALQPPHLRAIMPLEAPNDLYRSAYEGGILQPFWWDLEGEIPANDIEPESFSIYSKEELKEKVKAVAENPDIKFNTNFVRNLARYRSAFFDFMIHPTDGPFWHRRSGYTKYDQIKVPVYSGGPWMPGGFRGFSQSAFDDFNAPELNVPKKMSIFGHHDDSLLPGLPEYREEILRWWDHWLKGVDTGIMDEPPIRIYVIGDNQYRYEKEWPLARTQWTKFYLRTFNRLSTDAEPRDPCPDGLVHEPPIVTGKIQSLSYATEAFHEPVEVTGPIVFHLYAAMDQDDGNFIAKLWSVAPDGSQYPIGRGQLKASHRALDKEKSKPWHPVHRNINPEPVIPGEIYEYVIPFSPVSYVFKPGYRMALEITTADPIRIPYWHVINMMGPLPSMRLTFYKIYRDAVHDSHLLVPIIPRTAEQ